MECSEIEWSGRWLYLESDSHSQRGQSWISGDPGRMSEIPNSKDLITIFQGRPEEKDRYHDFECGLGAWKPKWLQSFATSKCFMAVYGMLGTVQAMAFIYFISTLTTIERRFGIQSKTTGWMLSGNEISQIMLSLILSYYGGQRNRPVWIAWGVAFSALSCFILATPHFIFGAGPAALALTKEYEDQFRHLNHSVMEQKERLGLCTEEKNTGTCDAERESSIAPLLIFLSQFLLGIGTTLYYSLGQPYIDDNSKKSNTPMLLGLSMSLRTIGPSFGFVVVYLCLRTYIDPTVTPTIGPKDPRWLGAWWLGWVILGSVMFLQAFLIAFFPKKLRKRAPKVEKITQPAEQPLKDRNDVNSNGIGKLFIDENEHKPSTTKDFLPSLIKLIRNKLLMVNIFSGVFYILGGSGYMTFMTKNMEVQFYKSSSEANIVIGPAILLSMVGAFIVSGYVISKFKPRPMYLLSWNVIVGTVFVVSEIIYIFIACPEVGIVGYDTKTKSFSLTNECNANCGCDNVKFSPVYLEESGLTFYSACHAGCNSIVKEGSLTAYGNCSCIPISTAVSIPAISTEDYVSYKYETYGGTVKDGYFPVNCQMMNALFVIIGFTKHFLGSSGKIGNILVNYRAVEPHEKSFAQGLALLLISLLAFIPGPIFYGYIIDTTCLIWDTSCGKEGNCWFYDRDAFRLYLNGTAAVFTTIGVLLDAVVCYLGRDLQLYEDDNERRGSLMKENLKKDIEKFQTIIPPKENT